ncbi:MAG: hypothetical protein LUC39_04515 [Clostridiales bacterium]|nr:hypothetical protein [Clostridiales bacterium]
MSEESLVSLFGTAATILAVFISHLLSTSNRKKEYKKALLDYEDKLEQKSHVLAKRMTVEYDIFQKLNYKCEEISEVAKRLCPGDVSTQIINCSSIAGLEKNAGINLELRNNEYKRNCRDELARKIGNLDSEIAVSEAFIPREYAKRYFETKQKAEEFLRTIDIIVSGNDSNEIQEAALDAQSKFEEHRKLTCQEINTYMLGTKRSA